MFYGDLYGIRANVENPMTPSCDGLLPILMQARKLYANGEQQDYFDQPNCIGPSGSLTSLEIASSGYQTSCEVPGLGRADSPYRIRSLRKRPSLVWFGLRYQ